MRKLTLNKHTVVIYDSIDELPIINFSRYNKFLLIDSGIGGSLEDIDNHIERTMRYVISNPTMAIQELQNMRQALYFINQGVSPKNLAFAALIVSVDGIDIGNTSDDLLHELLSKLNGSVASEITSLLEDIKKKIETELDLYFPTLINNIQEKELYDLLKKRTSAILESIINDTDATSNVSNIDDEFFKLSAPKIFHGKDSVELKYVKEFEKACLIISQEMGLRAKDMTTLQFYLALDQIKKEQAKITTNGKRTNQIL